MTLNEMTSKYNALSAAHKYIVGFVQSKKLYYSIVTFEKMSAFFKLDHTSAARGGYAKVRIRLTSEQRKAMIESGEAVLLGEAMILDTDDKYNKGERFERVITETLTSETWVKDSIPFTVQGDIQVNGEEIQVKFDGAELTNEKTLGRLLAA